MMTFLIIFLVLVGINLAMLFISLRSVGQNSKKSTKTTEQPISPIYPLDILTSNYKKAV
jgi:flagellar basal body-associated protein FliL